MACGCKKGKAEDGCVNCVNGSVAGATAWIDCSYWTERPSEPVKLTAGQYVRYTNNSVRTREGSKCANYIQDSV